VFSIQPSSANGMHEKKKTSTSHYVVEGEIRKGAPAHINPSDRRGTSEKEEKESVSAKMQKPKTFHPLLFAFKREWKERGVKNMKKEEEVTRPVLSHWQDK